MYQTREPVLYRILKRQEESQKYEEQRSILTKFNFGISSHLKQNLRSKIIVKIYAKLRLGIQTSFMVVIFLVWTWIINECEKLIYKSAGSMWNLHRCVNNKCPSMNTMYKEFVSVCILSLLQVPSCDQIFIHRHITTIMMKVFWRCYFTVMIEVILVCIINLFANRPSMADHQASRTCCMMSVEM